MGPGDSDVVFSTTGSVAVQSTTGITTVSATYNAEDTRNAALLGDTFNISMVIVTVVLAIMSSVLNVAVMTFNWPKVKKIVPFIYFMLSLSDFATGLCAGLHTVLFLVMVVTKDLSGSIFWVLVPSYFATVVAFKVSAFISMLFAVIRTINIATPFRRVSRKAAVVSVFVYTSFWVLVFLVELAVVLKTSSAVTKRINGAADLVKSVMVGFFYKPSQPKLIQHILHDLYTESTEPGEHYQHLMCVVNLFYTALPVFLCAGITFVATIIQVAILMVKKGSSGSSEDAIPEKKAVSITIIIISVLFIVCASCTLYQPIIGCSSAGDHTDDRLRLIMFYVMGYLPFFLNAALNPLILVVRVTTLRQYFFRSMPCTRGLGRAGTMSRPNTTYKSIRHSTVSSTASLFRNLLRSISGQSVQ